MKKIWLVFIGYAITILGLFIYSYTQVDLNLTLTRNVFALHVLKQLQYIGYFQRPISTYIYCFIIVLLFIFYGLLLWLAHKKKISLKHVWLITIVTALVLTFSYNAFSYDLFNYIFDAKILTVYHLNPYFHKALDFPQDPMVHFMRWTHRTYPYSPIWLIFTVPLSFIGHNIFLPTFFLFKAAISATFLGTLYFISKIMRKIKKEDEIFSVILFALNPLVIIESLVSSHLDIVMMFLALWSLYLFLNQKNVRGILLLMLSVGVKFGTIFLLPIYIAKLFFDYISSRHPALDAGSIHRFLIKSRMTHFLFLCSIAMIIPVILSAARANYQPWYLLDVLPIAVLLGRKYYIEIPIIMLSFFGLLEYIPYLYQGDYNGLVPTILNILTISGIIVTSGMVLVWKFFIPLGKK